MTHVTHNVFYVHFRPAHDTATDTQWQLPEVVLTQSVSPDVEHDVLETCRVKNINKYEYIEKIVRHVGHLPRIEGILRIFVYRHSWLLNCGAVCFVEFLRQLSRATWTLFILPTNKGTFPFKMQPVSLNKLHQL